MHSSVVVETMEGGAWLEDVDSAVLSLKFCLTTELFLPSTF